MVSRSPMKEKSCRLDQLLVERGLTQSRERAQALVMRGLVEVDGQPAHKSGQRVSSNACVTVRGPDHPYVGRGALKLVGALDRFGLDPMGRVALDVGASTGGFTDCLLQRGAARVYALDVGRGQIHERLRGDPRVIVLERINARNLRPQDLPERVSVVVVDVSFISLRQVLPPLRGVVTREADLVPLVKPQFEVGRREVGKGGIVKDPELHRRVLHEILETGRGLGFSPVGVCVSPLAGAEGNREYFIHFRAGSPTHPVRELEAQIEEALIR